MTKILISGGTGLVGTHLVKKFQKKGYEVAILSRNPKAKNEYKWNVSKSYIDKKALENTSYIIHLAGAGIADKRWSKKRKKTLISSRVETIKLLYKYVNKYNINIKGFISASGVGYYGISASDKIYTENDSAGTDFLSEVCKKWEKQAKEFKKTHIPTTILRTGVVLATKNSALQKMNTPLFLSYLGNGKQHFPWIHITDLCNLYIKAVEDNNFRGIFNAVAPDFKTNKSFIKTLSEVIKKPIFPLAVPKFVLKIIFGKMSSILLKGNRISAEKTQQHYSFRFPDLKSALKDIYN